jgi:hypothetical protein
VVVVVVMQLKKLLASDEWKSTGCNCTSGFGLGVLLSCRAVGESSSSPGQLPCRCVVIACST